MNDTVEILGVRVDRLTMREATQQMLAFFDDGKSHVVFTPNSEIIDRAYHDKAFLSILNSSDLNTADGIGVVYASRILKRPLVERVAGYDLILETIKACAPMGKKLFLFGAKPGVAEEAARILESRYPGIQVCGCRNGYFSDNETASIVEEINAAGPDMLLVCLGAPKQENWIFQNRDKLRVSIMIGAGGTLDTLTGRTERAPESWQRLGLEWAYRLKKEPMRFFRMLSLPKFALTVLFRGKRY